jgi:hypothetical protein
MKDGLIFRIEAMNPTAQNVGGIWGTWRVVVNYDDAGLPVVAFEVLEKDAAGGERWQESLSWFSVNAYVAAIRFLAAGGKLAADGSTVVGKIYYDMADSTYRLQVQ